MIARMLLHGDAWPLLLMMAIHNGCRQFAADAKSMVHLWRIDSDDRYAQASRTAASEPQAELGSAQRAAENADLAWSLLQQVRSHNL